MRGHIYLDNLTQFVGERQRVWHRRHVLHRSAPWTDDPILGDYRFTNLQRELDRGTVYLMHLLADHADAPLQEKAANVMLYRWINNVQTWETCFGWFTDEDELDEGFGRMHARHAAGYSPFSPAWTKPSGGLKAKGRNSVEYLHETVRLRWDSSVVEAETVEQMFNRIKALELFGTMIAWQTTLDLLYLRPDLDDDTWVCPLYGESRGSAAGARRVAPADNPNDTIRWLRDHREDWLPQDWNEICWDGKPDLSLADLEHTLCEFDKWMRVRRGEGSMKRRYRHDAGSPSPTPVPVTATSGA